MPNLPGTTQVAEQVNTPEAPVQQGYEEGFNQGYAEGKAQAQAEQQGLLEQLSKMLEEVQRVRQSSAQEGLQDIAVALHAIFRAVFHYELRASDELLSAMAAEIAQILNAEREPSLYLNRADLAQLEGVLNDELKARVKPDDALPSGVIRASAGKSMLELDVVGNLEQILAAAITTSAVEPDDECAD